MAKTLAPVRQAHNSVALTPEQFQEIIHTYRLAHHLNLSVKQLLTLTQRHLPDLVNFAASFFNSLDASELTRPFLQGQHPLNEPSPTAPAELLTILDDLQQIKRNQELLLLAIQKQGRSQLTPVTVVSPTTPS
ncbi:hypothetical protein GCM10008957_30510 [Deinococcus ruber]|uniref:Uncharacterized protein n=2 Tax=Deinococcus ruber TaxID=1848197 RepID=A0A918CDM7_9DEIO|nr:hypothetical protein GCM10008957_30510 [Deinococcus ruber]